MKAVNGKEFDGMLRYFALRCVNGAGSASTAQMKPLIYNLSVQVTAAFVAIDKERVVNKIRCGD